MKNTTGQKSVGVGSYAGCSGTTSSYNAIVGYQANRSLTTGCYNATLGYVAAYANTTGEYNTAVGNGALCSNIDGDNNVAIGRVAGAFTDTGSGAASCTVKGTYLGACTRASQASPVNETVIGFCACGCGNNTVNIGNCDTTMAYVNCHLCVPNIFHACCGRFTNDVCINGNELFFSNDSESVFIRAADQLTIESDYDNDDSGEKPIVFKTNATEIARMTSTGS